jgi:phosphinothricin acetyltransferase
MRIRPADLSDLEAVHRIYAREVLEKTGSFEIEPPSLDEIERRYHAVLAAKLTYVIADFDGDVGGFAYVHPYKDRAGYRFTVETSIYVAPKYQQRGVGSALLAELVTGSIAAGKRQMVAIVGDSANRGSIRVHEKAGFLQVGTLKDVGFKFDRFLDIVIMQRSLDSPAGS